MNSLALMVVMRTLIVTKDRKYQRPNQPYDPDEQYAQNKLLSHWAPPPSLRTQCASSGVLELVGTIYINSKAYASPQRPPNRFQERIIGSLYAGEGD
jgi:hypothetical protein